jgi:RNA polymerase sigma-54 factor
MIELNLQPNLVQTLDLFLSPRLLQMLKMLNLPYMDMVEHICKEAEENVMLEVERKDEYVEFIRYLTSDRKIKKEANLSELPGLENIGNVSKTLEGHLLEQLELEELDETYHNLAKAIIENIDDFGYVINYPGLREKLMQTFSVSRPTVDKALKIIQGFEPDGIGARDLKECLLLQIEAYSFESDELQAVLTKTVQKHLEDLGQQNYAGIAQALGIPESGVEEIANFIKNHLNPHPAASFGGEARHVIPSFAIEPADEGFKLVNLEQRYGPVINLSPHYLKILDDPKADEKTKAFLKEKLKAAKNLIEDFSKRTETLEKVVRKIIGTQAEFLRRGSAWLQPLSQKSLADEFGLHPSTISRAVAGKYIQTSQGLFPLKFLCPRGPKGFTVKRIKMILSEIIKQEDKKQPLSDSQLKDALVKQGVKIDRRTVAYYRKGLNIPAAETRQKA